MQSATQSAMHNCAVDLGFRVCSPYRHGRGYCTPTPGKKKQKRYDYARAVYSVLIAKIVLDFNPRLLLRII